MVRGVGKDLVRAAHPEPCVAVTLVATLLAVSMGASAETTTVLAAAALTGQLTVGWLNDLLDVERDREVGRRDKPLAVGRLSVRAVWWCWSAALVATVATSLALGPAAGSVHLALVVVGWAYDLGLKRTAWSWLPYAVCFGLLPLAVSLAATGAAAPAWMVLAGSLLGVGAHLVNVVPDLEDDVRTGVVGLPHRLGARGSLDVATVLLVAGSLVVVVGPSGRLDITGIVTLAVVAVLATTGRLRRDLAFRATLGIALVDVVALLARS